MIVDCHTHWGDVFIKRDGVNPVLWLDVLHRHGVTHAIVMPYRGLFHAGYISVDNEDIAKTCAASTGAMIPFCTIHTWDRKAALKELDRCFVELGFRGLKIHPWVQGFSPLHPVMDEACDIARSYNAPVLFHDGTPPYSLPSQIALLAARHPQTQIILGHSGLLEFWREALYVLNSHNNLWACLSGPHLEGMRQIIDKGPEDRILWGTDFGINGEDFYDYRLGLFNELGLPETTRKRILAENPSRLLGLKMSGY